MENSKRKLMLKTTANEVITAILRIVWISLVLIAFYPQDMCRSSERIIDNKIDISEKIIHNDIKYLNEDIKMPVFVNGSNKENEKRINSILYKDIVGRVTETEKYVADEFKDINEKPLFPYEIKSIFVVTEKNKDIISLYNDYYEFLGGAHGSTTRTGYTVDRNSEKILGIKELFLDEYDYRSFINNKIKENIRKEPDKYFYTADNFKGISDNQGFYIKDGNLIVFFEQYEIAPYVAGIPEFLIPIKEFGKNFKYELWIWFKSRYCL